MNLPLNLDVLNDLTRQVMKNYAETRTIEESFRTHYRILDQFGRTIDLPDGKGFKIGKTVTVKRPERWQQSP